MHVWSRKTYRAWRKNSAGRTRVEVGVISVSESAHDDANAVATFNDGYVWEIPELKAGDWRYYQDKAKEAE